MLQSTSLKAVPAAQFGKFYNLQKSSSVSDLPLSRWQAAEGFDNVELKFYSAI